MSLVNSHVASGRFTGSRRRVEILEAALACFGERGYDATTVEEIRQRCGASNGSFYHVFPSKRDVAVALFVDYSRLYADHLSSAVAAARTARAFVVSVSTFAIRWAFEEEPAFAAVAESLFVPEIMSRADVELDSIVDRMRELVREHFEKWSDRGALKRVPVDLLHPVLFGPAEAYVRQRLHGRTSLDPDAAADTLSDLVWKAVRA